MKRLVVVMLLICIAAPATSRAADACASDRPQINALMNRYLSAIRAKDLDGVMSIYEPGKNLFAFDVVPPRQFAGWTAYKKDWQGFFAAFKGPIRDTMSELTIDCDGTLGFSHDIERMSGVLVNGQRLDITTRVTDVYRKINGTWYIVHEHVSVPVDLGTGKAVLQSKP